MPFKKWLEHHKLNLILPLFYETQTSQGYGYIEEVPTYYGMSSSTLFCCWREATAILLHIALCTKLSNQHVMSANFFSDMHAGYMTHCGDSITNNDIALCVFCLLEVTSRDWCTLETF